MIAFVVRRLIYGCFTVLGVLALLFLLFFTVTNPDDMARLAVGEKASPEVYEQWKKGHGYDRPRVYNPEHSWASSQRYTDTLLWDHFSRMLSFDFGNSDADNEPIRKRIVEGAKPSLVLTLPLFFLGLLVGITLSLFVAFFRDTYIDRMGVVLCVAAMSIAPLLYVIVGQYVIGKLLRWFPISGFDPSPEVILRFLWLPIVIGVFTDIGKSVRFYRTVFVEETSQDYVRTARAKGCGEGRIMFRHVLRNAMLPVLTNVVMAIPFLFMGSLLLESFFGIPGLGAITVDAIHANDFSTLRTMVFIGSLLFIVAQIATDISYTVADPRVRLE